jgi:membrane associated rhomboid family serine protease
MGPITDLALTKARSGWRLYLGLIVAGIVTNLLALMSRTAGRLLGVDPSWRPFGSWMSQAIVTYSLSGAVAGLIGAICFFHLHNRPKSDTSGMRS